MSFALGTQTCDGTTDAQGAATCTIASVDAPLTADATVPVKASFARRRRLPARRGHRHRAAPVRHRAGLRPVGRRLAARPAGGVRPAPTPDTGTVRTAGASSTAPPCTADINALVLSSKTLCARVDTKAGPGGATSTASLEEATVGLPGLPVLKVSGIKAVSTSTCSAVSGSTDLTLTVAGVPVAIDGSVNESVDLGVVGARLVVNEQVRDGGRRPHRQRRAPDRPGGGRGRRVQHLGGAQLRLTAAGNRPLCAGARFHIRAGCVSLDERMRGSVTAPRKV
ncbi:choice-of-anchor P family protein [Streptomyces lasalocidi]